MHPVEARLIVSTLRPDDTASGFYVVRLARVVRDSQTLIKEAFVMLLDCRLTGRYATRTGGGMKRPNAKCEIAH